MNVLGLASAGIQSSSLRFARAAQALNASFRPPAGDRSGFGRNAPDLPGAVVGMLTARIGYTANLAMVRTAEEMLGQVIDVLA